VGANAQTGGQMLTFIFEKALTRAANDDVPATAANGLNEYAVALRTYFAMICKKLLIGAVHDYNPPRLAVREGSLFRSSLNMASSVPFRGANSIP
jgi:hypothetical protein